MLQIMQGINDHILWGKGCMDNILVLEKHIVRHSFCFGSLYPDYVAPIMFIGFPNAIPISGVPDTGENIEGKKSEVRIVVEVGGG